MTVTVLFQPTKAAAGSIAVSILDRIILSLGLLTLAGFLLLVAMVGIECWAARRKAWRRWRFRRRYPSIAARMQSYGPSTPGKT